VLALFVIDGESVGRALALVFLMGCGEGTQPGVPVGLERVGD
jgi:hypothetical protein